MRAGGVKGLRTDALFTPTFFPPGKRTASFPMGVPAAPHSIPDRNGRGRPLVMRLITKPDLTMVCVAERV